MTEIIINKRYMVGRLIAGKVY